MFEYGPTCWQDFVGFILIVLGAGGVFVIGYFKIFGRKK